MEILTPSKRDSLKRYLPDWIEPTRTSHRQKSFSGPDWLFERKLDGIRCISYKQGNDVRLLSAEKDDITSEFPQIAAMLKLQRGNFIADGEIVVGGLPAADFLPSVAKKPSYVLYDMMHGGDYDLKGLRLRTRKEILKTLLTFEGPLHYCAHVDRDGRRFYEEACAKGWAGIVAKNINSTYESGVSTNWLEVPCEF